MAARLPPTPPLAPGAASGSARGIAWRRWLLAAVLAGLAWRAVRYGSGFPMWGDEAFVAVNLQARDAAGLLRPLEHDMVAPVGFLLAEHAVGGATHFSEEGLRALPFLAGLAAFLLFARFAAARAAPAAAALATALLAASFYPVRHAAEVKPYAFDQCAGVVLLLLAARALDAPRDARRVAAFAVAGAVAVWFSYPAAFVAGGATCVLLVAARRADRAPTANGGGGARGTAFALAAGALVVASFATMYLLVGRGQQWTEATAETSGQWSEHFPPLREPWLLPWWLVKEHTGNLFAYPNGGRVFGSAATTLLVAIGAISTWRSGRRRFVLLLLSPLLPMFVAAALRKYPYGGSARTTLHLATPICLLAGIGLARVATRWLSPRGATWAVRSLVAALVVACLVGAAVDVARPWKKRADFDVRATARALGATAHPGDRWVLFGRFAASDASGVTDRASYAPPDLRAWGGSPARLRYQLERWRGATPLLYGPDPASLAREAKGRTLVLGYVDDDAPFPEARWAAYLDAATKVLGPWTAASDVVFDGGPETLRVAAFSR